MQSLFLDIQMRLTHITLRIICGWLSGSVHPEGGRVKACLNRKASASSEFLGNSISLVPSWSVRTQATNNIRISASVHSLWVLEAVASHQNKWQLWCSFLVLSARGALQSESSLCKVSNRKVESLYNRLGQKTRKPITSLPQLDHTFIALLEEWRCSTMTQTNFQCCFIGTMWGPLNR